MLQKKKKVFYSSSMLYTTSKVFVDELIVVVVDLIVRALQRLPKREKGRSGSTNEVEKRSKSKQGQIKRKFGGRVL